MRALVLSVLLAVTAAAPASAQAHGERPDPEWTLRARVGAEYYELGHLRNWQDAELGRLRSQGVSAEATGQFPPYFSFGVQAGHALGHGWQAGLSARYASTGARIYAGDYSGELALDWTVQRRSVGAFAEREFLRRGALRGHVALHVLADRGTVRYRTRVQIGDEEQRDEAPDLRSWSVSAENEIGVERLVRGVLVGARAGAGFSFLGDLELGGEQVGLPGSRSGSTVRWLGWRLGLSLGVPLG